MTTMSYDARRIKWKSSETQETPKKIYISKNSMLKHFRSTGYHRQIWEQAPGRWNGRRHGENEKVYRLRTAMDQSTLKCICIQFDSGWQKTPCRIISLETDSTFQTVTSKGTSLWSISCLFVFWFRNQGQKCSDEPDLATYPRFHIYKVSSPEKAAGNF